MADESGTLEILNVGSGHLTLTFNKDDRPEIERAKRIVTDMLARGYAIFVQVGEELRPVRRFDPKTATYYITDVGGEVRGGAPPRESSGSPPATGAVSTCARCGRSRHKGRCRKVEVAVPMAHARATAVGRSAGG